MGKIFTVEIEYSLYKHKALVSVSGLNHEPAYHVQLIDSFLKEIFQTEHIRYKGTEGYLYCDLNDDLAILIFERIANAIEQKLYGGTALIRKLFFNYQREED